MSSKMQDMTEQVKRHSFWIMCGLVAVCGLVSWYLATASLASTYAAGKTKIESFHSTIAAVTNADQHPNQAWIADYEKKNSLQKDQAIKAWEKLYSDQKQRVYVWSKRFDERFDVFKKDVPPKPGTVDVSILETYQNYVKYEFKRLCEIVDAAWVEPSAAGGGADVGRGFNDDRGGAVNGLKGPAHRLIWNRQPEMQAPYIWSEKPTELQVWFTHEEIWVMEAICKAIAATNAGSGGAHDAGVKVIDELVVAFRAAEDAPNGTGENRITRLKAAPAIGAGGEGSTAAAPIDGEAAGKPARPVHPLYSGIGGSSSETRGSSPAPSGEGAAAGPASFDEQLKSWRYVDRKGKPLTKEELAASTMHEFRLMPWRVRMVIDQRKFDDLMVAFRNTDMPLEIRQTRINPQATSGGGETRGASSSTFRGDDSGGGDLSSTDTITVELRGVAYLINPPDREKIGIAPVEAGAATGDATAVTEPNTAEPNTSPTDGSPPANDTPPAANTTPPPANNRESR